MLKRVIKAPLVPMSKAYYSPAIQIDDFLFVAGFEGVALQIGEQWFDLPAGEFDAFDARGRAEYP